MRRGSMRQHKPRTGRKDPNASRNVRGMDQLAVLATALGGVVNGKDILCPSPRCGPDDRTCRVRINPSYPSQFFVYDCEGSLDEAYAMVRAQLGLKGRVRTTTAMALKVWNETASARDTLVQVYLRSRAIVLPPPEDLRYHHALKHRPSGFHWPAIVSARRNSSGAVVAVHRTYLADDGKRKAPVDPAKMDLGPPAGTAIRLAPVAAEIAVAEGIETALSVMQDSGLPTWAAGSAVALRLLDLPPEVCSVIICADGDESGRTAAQAAATRWRREDRRVRIAQAPEGKDFNDLLIEHG